MLSSFVFLKGKLSQDHIHNYNINTSYLELSQLRIRTELGNPQAITKDLAVIRCHFQPVQDG